MDISPLDKVAAILGEHYRNYVIIFQEDDDPTGYDLAFSDPYAAKGLLEACTKYHNTYLEGGTELDDFEWVEAEDEEEEDPSF